MKASFLALLATSLVTATPAFAGDVAITLTDVSAATGPVYVSLQREGDFMQPRGSYGEIVRNPVSGQLTLTLRDVAPGDYALMVWHDIDGDGQFDRMADGRPLDGWAMSFNGNIADLRAAPTFAQSRFTVTAAGATVRASMRYPAAE